MKVNIVFATHNGAETLDIMLSSMNKIDYDVNYWNLIAVDNASTDSTNSILQNFKTKIPLLILHCQERGKNKSLNTALKHIDGDIIIFTDDDVVVPADWVSKYVSLAKNHSSCSLFGGKIVPRWPGVAPSAIIDSIPLGPAFAVHSEAMVDGPVEPGMIWGPNMAVRREVFDKGHRFNEFVGPTVGTYIMGSEASFNRELARAGFNNWYSNDIVVEHIVRPRQLTALWLWKRALKFGRGKKFFINQNFDNNTIVSRIKNIKLWMLRQIIEDFLLILPCRIFNLKEFYKRLWRFGVNVKSI